MWSVHMQGGAQASLVFRLTFVRELRRRRLGIVVARTHHVWPGGRTRCEKGSAGTSGSLVARHRHTRATGEEARARYARKGRMSALLSLTTHTRT